MVIILLMKKDILIDEIRETRKKISAEFGHDTKKLVEYYMEMQKRFGSRLRRVKSRGPEADMLDPQCPQGRIKPPR
jgi:hypothetical protein